MKLCTYSSSSSEDVDRCFLGIGHTKFCVSGGQNSLILLNKYHCCCSDSLSGGITGGKVDGCGLHDISFRRLILFSFEGVMLHVSRTNTIPGELAENLKWEIFLYHSMLIWWYDLKKSRPSYTLELSLRHSGFPPVDSGWLWLILLPHQQYQQGNQLWFS